MANHHFPEPLLTLTKSEARRFILAHQNLLPPRSLQGKEALLDFVRRVGCIQYDPVNVVGCNPDLVLQSRVGAYRPQLLEGLLYQERLLWDGFDKVQSIYLAEDWPYFSRRRAANRENHWFPHDQAVNLQPLILETMRKDGPLCSLDLELKEKISGFWGVPIRAERAALENLYNMGEIGIHHRVGTRRYFDLIERLLPQEILTAPDPHDSLEEYHDWHILRRVGAAGLAHAGGAEYWLGILEMKSPERRASLIRLVRKGELIPIAVEGVTRSPLFMRARDRDLLETTRHDPACDPRAAFIAPLDNLIWQRDLINWLFDFDYVWEVYKPAHKREYGHYVLPVLYGERFVARCEPVLDRKANRLVIRNWWWEEDAPQDTPLMVAMEKCLLAFAEYAGASTIAAEGAAANEAFIRRLSG